MLAPNHPLIPAIGALNEQQRTAVLADDPRIFVVAGAGAGKTRVLSLRIARLLIEGVPAQYILAVTFTRDAAREMRERVSAILTELRIYRDLPEIRTLHSWGQSLLRRNAEKIGRTAEFSIYDEVDHADVIRQAATDLGLASADRSRLPTLLKDARVRQSVEERLRVSNALTFDDIERLTQELIVQDPEVQALWTSHYRHILVDEFQDTNLVQLSSLHGLSPANLFAVGDSKQAIYSFRGVDPEALERAARDWTHIDLPVNYRSRPEIVALANSCFPPKRYTPMVANARPGGPDTVVLAAADEGSEGEPHLIATILENVIRMGRRPGDIAILARTWKTLRTIQEALVTRGIAHHYCGGDTDLWSTPDGRAVARAAMLARNPADDNLCALLAEWGALGTKRFADIRAMRIQALRERRRLIDVLAEADGPCADAAPSWARFAHWLGLARDGDGLIEKLVEPLHVSLGVASSYEAAGLTTRAQNVQDAQAQVEALGITEFCAWWGERTVREKIARAQDANLVQLTTVHGFKGLERETIVLADVGDDVFPRKWGVTPESEAEDNRVFYVAVTRARDQLVLTRGAKPWSEYVHRWIEAREAPDRAILTA